jgi:hypothetical protein
MPHPTRLRRLVIPADLLPHTNHSHKMQLIPRMRCCKPGAGITFLLGMCKWDTGPSSVKECAYHTGILYATPTVWREGVRWGVCGQVLLPLQLAIRAANTCKCTPEHNFTAVLHAGPSSSCLRLCLPTPSSF